MWIFGYGSLIWKADFPFEEKLPGCIKGFQRRFWQGSIDHRGVPGKPGRVVTIITSENAEQDCVWGMAYKIERENIDEVTKYLDYREKDGYQKVSTLFYPKNSSKKPFKLIVYVGSETNPFFLGPASIDSIACQIYGAEGPSGRNVDYVYNLAEAMRNLFPEVNDEHLFEVETALKKIQGSTKLVS